MATLVFISWAGDRAKQVAAALDRWLPLVVHGVKTWFSPNMEAGRRWDDTMAKALQGANLGILCLTPDNMREPWIAFEAGALAKQVEVARVVPFLLDLTPGNLSQTPLASFQAKLADKDGALAIVTMLNGLVEESQRRSEEHLRQMVDAHWPALETAITAARGAAPVAPAAPDVAKMVEEVLTLVRGFATKIDLRRADATADEDEEVDASAEEEGHGVAAEIEDLGPPPEPRPKQAGEAALAPPPPPANDEDEDEDEDEVPQ